MRAVFAGMILCLGFFGPPAFADDAAPAPAAADAFYGDLNQVQLSEDQVKHYIDSMADMHAAMGDAPSDAPEPDAQTMAKLEAVARAHGFKDFNEYNTVAGNIQLVLDGIDPDSKIYVGADKMIQKSIAEVKADDKLAAADKQANLADLQTQLKSVMPVKYKSNIDLVVRNYDKLSAD
jgi:hypothetical protein